MNTIKRHLKGYLRAISQSFFFYNEYFGLAILLTFLFFDSDYFICGFLASLIGYIYSIRYSTPKVLKDWGLITINGFFFGIAMASLYYKTPAFYFSLIFGAMTIPLITKAAFEVLQHWKLSPFVIPYIFMVWVIWMCGHENALPQASQSWFEVLPHFSSVSVEWTGNLRYIGSIFQSMGRLLFLPNSFFGMAILGLVTAFSPRRGLYFLFGTIVATVAVFLISTGPELWPYHRLTYCAGLIGLGLASFPERFNLRTISLFCALSAVLTLATGEFLKAMNLPILSLPYVLTLWFAMLSRLPKLNMTWAPTSKPVFGMPQLVHGSKLTLEKIEEPQPEKMAVL